MELPQGSYFYFGRDSGGGAADIWVYVTIDSKQSVEATLKRAAKRVRWQTIPTGNTFVNWLRWESRNDPSRHIFHRESYLENFDRLVQDRSKAKRLKGVVVTTSIGGLDRATVDAMQEVFADAELHESTLPPPDSESSDRFVSGRYFLPPGYYSGESYEFRSGRFTCHSFGDMPLGPRPEEGSYKIDGARVTLFFDKPRFRPFVFYYRLVDGVRVLLDPDAMRAFESEHRLIPRFYVSFPDADPSDSDWWAKGTKGHPEFSKMVPDSASRH